MDEQLRLLRQRFELAQQDFNYAEPEYIDLAIYNLGQIEMELKTYREETGIS